MGQGELRCVWQKQLVKFPMTPTEEAADEAGAGAGRSTRNQLGWISGSVLGRRAAEGG